jgi:hypothetical protein
VNSISAQNSVIWAFSPLIKKIAYLFLCFSFFLSQQEKIERGDLEPWHWRAEKIFLTGGYGGDLQPLHHQQIGRPHFLQGTLI